MAERKATTGAPKGEVKTNEDISKNEDGSAVEAAKGSPVEEANKAAAKAEDERIKVLEEVGKVYLESGVSDDLGPTAGADALREAVAKQLEEQGEDGPKTDDDGNVLGVDGVNPVSNENPDPRAVR